MLTIGEKIFGVSAIAKLRSEVDARPQLGLLRRVVLPVQHAKTGRIRNIQKRIVEERAIEQVKELSAEGKCAVKGLTRAEKNFVAPIAYGNVRRKTPPCEWHGVSISAGHNRVACRLERWR